MKSVIRELPLSTKYYLNHLFAIIIDFALPFCGLDSLAVPFLSRCHISNGLTTTPVSGEVRNAGAIGPVRDSPGAALPTSEQELAPAKPGTEEHMLCAPGVAE